MQQRVRNRQETVNNRFKNWGILRQRYRHDIVDHGDAFRCVAMLTQLSIDFGDKLFSVGYRDPPYNAPSCANEACDVPGDEHLDES